MQRLDVRGSLHHNSYRNSQQDATVYQGLLSHVYMKLSMLRATRRPSSGAQNCTSSLWFCICERLWTLRLLDCVQQPQRGWGSVTLPVWEREKKLVQSIRKGRGVLFGLYNRVSVGYFRLDRDLVTGLWPLVGIWCD